jgi:hypothetical protein
VRDEGPGEIELVGQIRGGAAKAQAQPAVIRIGHIDIGLADRWEDVAGGLRQILRDGLLVRQVRPDFHLEISTDRRVVIKRPSDAEQAEARRGDDVIDVAEGGTSAVVAVEEGAVDLPG